MANGTRVRTEVHADGPWSETLLWYARAVARMQERPLTDPTSWAYQAAVHGLDPPGQDPEFWDQCQHQTWYFLPWHRGYLFWFEQIVQTAIDEIGGGPTDWALPYWNYSLDDAQARVLPEPFRDAKTPDGKKNPLRVARNPGVNEGEEIFPAGDLDVSALDLPRFQADPFGGSAGFGGPATGFSHAGTRFGELEAVPHGAVHVDIGGLMSDPATAAGDPIFWLHHANIDRLWEIWRQTAGHTEPTSGKWRDLTFKLHDAQRAVVSFSAKQMLDTTAAPLSYRYDSLDDPRGAAPEEMPLAAMAMMGDPDSVPEMVGATEKALELGTGPTTTSFQIEAPSGPAAELEDVGAEGGPAVFLNVENVTGTHASTNYDVYLNLPEGADPAEHDDRRVGTLPTFGIERASTAEDEHGGSGLHRSFEITEVMRRLRDAGDWDPGSLRVTFVPRRAPKDVPALTVGRVSLYSKK